MPRDQRGMDAVKQQHSLCHWEWSAGSTCVALWPFVEVSTGRPDGSSSNGLNCFLRKQLCYCTLVHRGAAPPLVNGGGSCIPAWIPSGSCELSGPSAVAPAHVHVFFNQHCCGAPVWAERWCSSSWKLRKGLVVLLLLCKSDKPSINLPS